MRNWKSLRLLLFNRGNKLKLASKNMLKRSKLSSLSDCRQTRPNWLTLISFLGLQVLERAPYLTFLMGLNWSKWRVKIKMEIIMERSESDFLTKIWIKFSSLRQSDMVLFHKPLSLNFTITNKPKPLMWIVPVSSTIKTSFSQLSTATWNMR